MSRKSRLESLRKKIIDFEKELDARIEALLLVETDILKTGTLRSQWLTTVSCSVGGDSVSLRTTLDTLKKKFEFHTSLLALENARVEGFEESQTLGYLIAATKPYDPGESEDKRKKLLEVTSQINIEDLKDFLTQSIAARSNLNNIVCQLVHDTKTLQLQQEQRSALAVGEVHRRIYQYSELLHETSTLSKINDKAITGDYLVLRHNSRVAKEILVRSQNEANFARRALQEGIDQITLAAASQRDRVEQSSMTQLQDLTDQTRLKIMTREQELQELRMRKTQRSRSHKESVSTLVDACSEYNKKYADLQVQRKDDLERVGGELKRLREMVTNVESRLLKLSSADKDVEVEKFLSYKGNKISEKSGRAIIETLERRLKMLQHS